MALGDVRWKGVLTGCDNWGTVFDETAPFKENGIDMISYLIVPHDDLIEAYPHILQVPGALPIRTRRGFGRWMKYPLYWVEDSNPSRRNAIVRVLCTFDGRPTSHTRREEHLTVEIKRLKEENDRLRIASMIDGEEKTELLKERIQQAEQYAELNEKFKGGNQGGKEKEEDDK